MKSTKASGVLGILTLAIMASHTAIAEENTGWYIGGNIGESKAKIDDARIINDLQSIGLTTTSIDDADHDTGYKLFGGYGFTRNFALEYGYFNLGKFGYTATTMPAGTLNGEMKAMGINIDGVGMLPLTEKFSAFARLGVVYAEAKDSFSGTGAVNVLAPTASEKAANYKFGVGLQYDFTKALGGRLEAERYHLDDAVSNEGDIDLFSLGLVYRFGRGQTEKVAETTPVQEKKQTEYARKAYVATTVVVPVTKKTSQYCSILDFTFEIDGNEIQREEKEKLGAIGTYMNKYPDTTAVIEGHADNVGTASHNQTLSQQRAESVVDYLVRQHKIDSSRLSAIGYGDTRPVADNSTDEGKRQNRRIEAVIACVTDVEGLVVAPTKSTIAMEMEFDAYNADIKPEYRDELNKVVKFMKANPSITATVEGHAGKMVGNRSATPELSMEVSERRANNVVSYLVSQGVPSSRISAAAFGQERRVAYSTSLEGQQENRRVNIIFNYPNK